MFEFDKSIGVGPLVWTFGAIYDMDTGVLVYVAFADTGIRVALGSTVLVFAIFGAIAHCPVKILTSINARIV